VAGLLLSADPPDALDDELPGSAVPASAVLGSLAVADGDELSLVTFEEPPAGAEAASVPELESVDGAASDAGAGDVAGLDGSGVDACVVVVPPVEAGAVVVVAGAEAAGLLGAGAEDVPAPPVRAGPVPGVDPPPVPELGPEDVDVEVAPLDVVAVVDGADGGVPTDVEVTVPGVARGAPNGPASGLLDRCDARADTEASSLSRIVGGVAMR
jgi:hypothetical protein